MKLVLVLCAMGLGVASHQGMNGGQTVHADLLRVVSRLLPGAPPCTAGFAFARAAVEKPAGRTAMAGGYSLSMLGDMDGAETEGIPRLPPISRRLNALLIMAVFVVAGIAFLLYIGELVILGWVMDLLSAIEDFLSQIGMPKIHAQPDPLEQELVGDIVVITLRRNVATLRQCQSVEKQLKLLIDEHHCDFVLDFLYADRISKAFRGVMVHFMKAARAEAGRLGKPRRPVALPRGKIFRVFDNRERAVEEMSRNDDHGWVVLCSVPVGVRAVSDLA